MKKQLDDIDLYDVRSFPYERILERGIAKKPKGNPGRKQKPYYVDLITAFDIETTRIEEIEQSIMYIWQWYFDGIGCLLGRTWKEYIRACRKISKLILTKKPKKGSLRLVVYDFNLSYEFQFLRGVYSFKSKEVFCTGPRKILRAYMFKTFELRCAYLHSNMSLDKFTHQMKVPHAKRSGEEFNYNKIRYPWTKLSDDELRYPVWDVVGLVEAIKEEMIRDGDTLYTIPLTSTGYVRRDAKQAMRKVPRQFLLKQLPDVKLYTLLREAFRGGNVHANRLYAGKILENVSSADRSSAYPAEQTGSYFPIDTFHSEDFVSQERLNEIIFKRGRPCVFRCRMRFKLADKYWPIPYIAKAQCRDLLKGSYIEDNGRLLKGEASMTITDIDYRIIVREYDIEAIEIYELMYSRYGKLPQPLIDVTMEYFRNKTTLKGVEDMEYFYGKSKNKLNAIFGMSAQDPGKESVIFDGEEYTKDPAWDLEKTLTKYNKTAFQCYQWGVWITALARYHLEDGIEYAGDRTVYVDTDSVKYIEIEGQPLDWDAFNAANIEKARKAGRYATDPKGHDHYLGVFEYEGTYKRFRTDGAKKYAYEDEDGMLHITIAGVNKKKGAEELMEYGGLEAMKDGFTFQKAGGVELVYNDKPYGEYTVDGHKLEITENVVIRPSTYTLGKSGEYLRLLKIINAEGFEFGNIEALTTHYNV